MMARHLREMRSCGSSCGLVGPFEHPKEQSRPRIVKSVSIGYYRTGSYEVCQDTEDLFGRVFSAPVFDELETKSLVSVCLPACLSPV